jgi:hypothetical protein
LLVEMGSDVHAQDAKGRTTLQVAEMRGSEAVVSFLRKNTKINRRSKSTTAVPVVDPTAQAAAEVAAAEMAALLIAEEEDHKHSLHTKHGKSKKARKNRNRKKANQNELDTYYKGPDEAISGSMASSSSDRRNNAGEKDGMGRDAPHHNKSDEEVDAHGAEESASLDFDRPSSATLLSATDSAGNENTCIICLAGPHASLLLPCEHPNEI